METELPKDALPHWELAKKYDLIDFDLGVKTHRLQVSLYIKVRRTTSTRSYQLLPGRSTQIRLYGNNAAHSGERRFRLRHGTAA